MKKHFFLFKSGHPQENRDIIILRNIKYVHHTFYIYVDKLKIKRSL